MDSVYTRREFDALSELDRATLVTSVESEVLEVEESENVIHQST